RHPDVVFAILIDRADRVAGQTISDHESVDLAITETIDAFVLGSDPKVLLAIDEQRADGHLRTVESRCGHRSQRTLLDLLQSQARAVSTDSYPHGAIGGDRQRGNPAQSRGRLQVGRLIDAGRPCAPTDDRIWIAEPQRSVRLGRE